MAIWVVEFSSGGYKIRKIENFTTCISTHIRGNKDGPNIENGNYNNDENSDNSTNHSKDSSYIQTDLIVICSA